MAALRHGFGFTADSVSAFGTQCKNDARWKEGRSRGDLRNLDTWRSLKLSQYDHPTRACTQKALCERWPLLGDGSGVVHRDMYCAFLAAAADKGALHPSRIKKMWPAAQSLIGRARWVRPQGHQLVSVAGLLATATPGLGLPTPERVARQRASASGNASDVVVERPEPRRVDGDGPGTPGFSHGEIQLLGHF